MIYLFICFEIIYSRSDREYRGRGSDKRDDYRDNRDNREYE